ncbi:MAG: tRNA 2-selenouridine(34) synthase MnmH [Bacteroidota bacterium]
MDCVTSHVIASVSILDVLRRQEEGWPMVDVRSPKEFLKGHLPSAINIPLFSDEERHQIGKLYKQTGRDAAFLKGLELVGPKMADFVRKAQEISPQGKLLVHCWRGGMRSQSMAWLWQQAGLQVEVLAGGYKAFRTYLLEDLARPLQLIVVGGKTGCGKTELLQGLEAVGEQVIDLEGLANHKGSAFGGIGQEMQPTVEQFENDLWQRVQQLDNLRRIWVEDESHSIGRVYLPQGFWKQMQEAPVTVIEKTSENRLDRLIEDYASFPIDSLTEAVQKIRKRIGGQAYQDAILALEQRDFRTTATLALKYYDKAYEHGLKKRKAIPIHFLPLGTHSLPQDVQELIQFADTHISPP